MPGSIHTNSTTAESSAPVVPGGSISADLSTLIAFVLALPGLRDWLKLIILGGGLEILRRLSSSVWQWVLERLFVTAHLDDDDDTFSWVLVWLSSQPSWRTSHEVQVTTESYGVRDSATIFLDEASEELGAMDDGRKIKYFPAHSVSYSIWYKWYWMTVTRVKEGRGERTPTDTLTIRILSLNRAILDEWLLEVKRNYIAVEEQSVNIYTADTNDYWRYVAGRDKRPLKSIVLDPGVKDAILNDAHDFLKNKKWYSDRGIPYRRGYLLYGAPGTGKTSIIHGLAGELGLNIYIVSLSRSGLDDASLNAIISNLPQKCIALMEDIDCAFTNGVSREPLSKDESDSSDEKQKAPLSSRVSLSGLLNALDGVGAQEGRILFATTNKYQTLDPALLRPGRLDVHMEFKLASKFQMEELFKRFYDPHDEITDDDQTEDDKTPVSEDLIDLGQMDEKSATAVIRPSRSSSSLVSVPHDWTPIRLSRRKINALAAQFGEIMPERRFSMAALQGYLMLYKSRPHEAVNDAVAWVLRENAIMASKLAES